MGVATAIAIGATIASSAMSFKQAGDQKKAQRQAESDANKAMQEAKQKLEVNYYDKLAVKKEPYELEREALLSQGAQAIQAGAESERGAAATAGRVQMGMNEAQAGIRSQMGQELSNLEKVSATEDSRLRDVGVQLDLGQVAGAQLAAANAQELGAQAMTAGMQGLTSMGQQYIAGSDLYNKQKNINPQTGLPWATMQSLAAGRTQTSKQFANQTELNPYNNTGQQGGQVVQPFPLYNKGIQAPPGLQSNNWNQNQWNQYGQINPFKLPW